jgi:hypothetical protein
VATSLEEGVARADVDVGDGMGVGVGCGESRGSLWRSGVLTGDSSSGVGLDDSPHPTRSTLQATTNRTTGNRRLTEVIIRSYAVRGEGMFFLGYLPH